jgi:hypothetical protein
VKTGTRVVILAGRDVIERLKARALDTIGSLGFLRGTYPPRWWDNLTTKD